MGLNGCEKWGGADSISESLLPFSELANFSEGRVITVMWKNRF